MTPVTRRPFTVAVGVLALCVASAAARAEEPADAPPPSTAAETLPGAAEEVAESAQEPTVSAAASEWVGLAPLAGGLGGAVGVGAGAVAAVGAAYGLMVLQTWTVGASSAGWMLAIAALAQVATPAVLVGLPVLGAGVGAFGALTLLTAPPEAALGGVAAAVATPAGAVAGAVGGAVVGFASGMVLWGDADPLIAVLLGAAGGAVGVALGGVVGAATGGAVAGFLVAAVE